MSTVLWTPIERGLILDGAKTVFFRAHLGGYAGEDDQRSEKTTNINGERTITFEVGDFRVVDRYYVTPQSQCSGGSTMIFFRGSAVWRMSYGGEYPKEVIPFLKRALVTAYRRGEFRGGRGPERYIEGDLTYVNIASQGVKSNSFGASFAGFQGREEISTIDGDNLGFHIYFGFAMI